MVVLGLLFGALENVQDVVHQQAPLSRGAVLFRHAVVFVDDGRDEAVAAVFVLGLEDHVLVVVRVVQRVLVPVVVVVDVALVHVNDSAWISFLLLRHAPHVLVALDPYLVLKAVFLASLLLAAAITLSSEETLHASQR